MSRLRKCFFTRLVIIIDSQVISEFTARSNIMSGIKRPKTFFVTGGISRLGWMPGKLFYSRTQSQLSCLCDRYLPDFIMNEVVDRIVRSVLRTMDAENAAPAGRS
jgi:hypothetical protein